MAADDKQQTDTGLVCRLAHEHLFESAEQRNPVLNKLPLDFRGNVEEFAAGIVTNLDFVPTWRNTSSGQSFIWQKVNNYMWQKKFHEPIGRIERLGAGAVDNWHARRIVCELLQAWTVANKEKDEEHLDEAEVKSYTLFVVNVLHHYDRWTGRFSSDEFCKTLVSVLRKCEELQCVAASSEKHYATVLEKLYEKSSEFCDNALRVVMFGLSENHAEMEALVAQRGHVNLKLMTNRCWRTNSVFWASDYGQVIDTALVRADPLRFRCVGCYGQVPQTTDPPEVTQGQKGSCATWSMWTYEGGQFKVYEYNSVNEAMARFNEMNACAILVGPTGKVKDKAWGSNAFVSKVLQNEITMQQLHNRVDNHLNLHRAVVGLAPLPETVYKPPEAPASSPRAADAPSAPGSTASPEGEWFKRGWGTLTRGIEQLLDNKGAQPPTAAGLPTATAVPLARKVVSSRRPVAGDHVRIVQENEDGALESPDRSGTLGRVGVITEDDGSSQPYNVDMGDGKSRWYTEEWVLLIEKPPGKVDMDQGQQSPKVAASFPIAVAAPVVKAQPQREGSPTDASGASEAEAQPARERIATDASGASEAQASAKRGDDSSMPIEGKVKSSPCSEEGTLDCAASDAGTDKGDHMDWIMQCAVIHHRWTRSMQDEATGLAENFRGARRVKWMEGTTAKSCDMAALILDLPRKFSTLLECHVQVMGAVNSMVSRGGSKEGLAAIYALRQRSSITGQLGECMDGFMNAAQLCHGVMQHELYKNIEQNKRITGQLPSMQRAYLQSFNACFKLRDAILTEWHQLALKVNDSKLADEFRRCDAVARESYNQLMKVPVASARAAIGDARGTSTGQLALPASSSVPIATGTPLATALPVAAGAPTATAVPVAMAVPVAGATAVATAAPVAVAKAVATAAPAVTPAVAKAVATAAPAVTPVVTREASPVPKIEEVPDDSQK